MLKKFASAMVHLLFFAVVVAIAGYWGVRIFTPAPTAAPPPLPPPPLRDPDPVAAARMFGKVEMVQAVATNVQALGVFAAGKYSSAVLVVDGRPARAFLIGQEVSPGMRLVEVTREVAVLESAGGRQEVRMPTRPIAALGGLPPPPNFTREGNTLTAPMSGAAPALRAPTPPPAMPAMPPPAMPAMPAPSQVTPIPNQPQPATTGAPMQAQ